MTNIRYGKKLKPIRRNPGYLLWLELHVAEVDGPDGGDRRGEHRWVGRGQVAPGQDKVGHLALGVGGCFERCWRSWGQDWGPFLYQVLRRRGSPTAGLSYDFSTSSDLEPGRFFEYLEIIVIIIIITWKNLGITSIFAMVYLCKTRAKDVWMDLWKREVLQPQCFQCCACVFFTFLLEWT